MNPCWEFYETEQQVTSTQQHPMLNVNVPIEVEQTRPILHVLKH